MADSESGATRRGFIGGVLLMAGGAGMLSPSAGAMARRVPAPSRARRVVVAFHSDQLYLDHSGKAEPYLPPAGLRSLDGLDEDALRHLVYHL
jgi:hypothetical protein